MHQSPLSPLTALSSTDSTSTHEHICKSDTSNSLLNPLMSTNPDDGIAPSWIDRSPVNWVQWDTLQQDFNMSMEMEFD
ncbi:hypothetical protein ACO22_03823 [Paracoccidioides brasiliensis]|uniref:Uncharacterized protein n=1 Tax=Paracoccidioides brasiliensis TaxID=121759 RepID=A0A1D2JES4_PARBR|nr:hypothetical protein ACO22_03823 [Paracoccidioides brasiliensis]ODH50417.1 hypothetical protein GX48_03378 [Paracoccidioides brasiliensis]